VISKFQVALIRLHRPSFAWIRIHFELEEPLSLLRFYPERPLGKSTWWALYMVDPRCNWEMLGNVSVCSQTERRLIPSLISKENHLFITKNSADEGGWILQGQAEIILSPISKSYKRFNWTKLSRLIVAISVDVTTGFEIRICSRDFGKRTRWFTSGFAGTGGSVVNKLIRGTLRLRPLALEYIRSLALWQIGCSCAVQNQEERVSQVPNLLIQRPSPKLSRMGIYYDLLWWAIP